MTSLQIGKAFKRIWENYEIATGLVNKEPGLRCATFLTCLGPDGLHVVDGLKFDQENDSKDITKVITAMDTYCIGQTNVIYERYTFNRREQEPSESIDPYIAALRILAKTCNFGDLRDELIRDRIVVGIRDSRTRKKLLQETKLDLQRCIDICRSNREIRIANELDGRCSSCRSETEKEETFQTSKTRNRSRRTLPRKPQHTVVATVERSMDL